MLDASEKGHLRLFVAIGLPEEPKAQMAAAQAELRRGLPQVGVTWTRPEQLHLTLKFLGNVEGEQVEALIEQLRSVGGRFPPLQLRAEGVGAFPNLQFPRVIWAGLKDACGKLELAQREIEVVCRDFSPNEPEKEFTGHVTLGRVKRLKPREIQILSKLLSGVADRHFGEWTASGFDLMRSELSSEGARHTRVATFAFAAPP
jgi:2'-5' RNA ligase